MVPKINSLINKIQINKIKYPISIYQVILYEVVMIIYLQLFEY